MFLRHFTSRARWRWNHKSPHTRENARLVGVFSSGEEENYFDIAIVFYVHDGSVWAIRISQSLWTSTRISGWMTRLKMKRLEEVERARKEQEKLNQNRDDDEAGTVVAM